MKSTNMRKENQVIRTEWDLAKQIGIPLHELSETARNTFLRAARAKVLTPATIQIGKRAIQFDYEKWADGPRPKTLQGIQRNKNKWITLGALKAFRGDHYITAIIVLEIDTMAAALNLVRNISPNVAKIAAELILGDFSYLTLDDVRLCLENGLKSKYGALMDRLDAQVIYKWFDSYAEERMKSAEYQSEHQHQVEKKANLKIGTETGKKWKAQ